MAAPIYVRTKELVISDAKKASSCIEDAISAMSKVDNAVSGWDLYIDAAADGFVFANSESEVGACLSALRTKQTQLEKLITVMQTGTEKLEEADAGFKNEITDPNLWERLTTAVGRAIYSSTIGKVDALILGVAWLGTLFNGDASTTSTITYQHVIDEFDWSRTKLTDEDIKKIIDTERKLAEMKGEKLTDQRIRERLQAVYDEQTKELSEYEKYRALVEKANTAGPGEKQKADLCTFASMATILRRKQALEGKDLTFTRDSVRSENPRMVYAHEYSANGSTYKIKTDTAPLTGERMRALLDEHPEGVWVYDTGYPHAIVITDYEINADGTIQFFADDPVNNASTWRPTGRVKLEDTWFFDDGLNSSSSESFFGTINRVCYIE